MLHRMTAEFLNGATMTPLATFFENEGKALLIPNDQAIRHMDLAEGYLTESLPDKGMWVGWDQASMDSFTRNGGYIPSWAEGRADTVRNHVTDEEADIFVEYLLNDPFLTARCSYTGQVFRFALWDGNGKDALTTGGATHEGEIRFDWNTVLPAEMARIAMIESGRVSF